MFHFFVLSAAVAFNLQQEQLFRHLTGPGSGINPFVTLHDAPIANQIAYTSSDLMHVYVDFRRLAAAPHTTYNVLLHELAHTRGAQHGDGSREMAYAATVNTNGLVVDDGFLL